ncbi:WXG100 family type VII secretion target [Thermoactinomyces vulgaris]|jgi:WXG100 family type VII secretion target|uniref:WXG100 family type VII secretion target n=1 Tax=Thermoactinomyces TaxID=2023 RepID=UPI001F3E4960|nr:WXG100 family type VII secretion target [Thermoactinomyces vulgaris]MCF6135453.1 WXG100 family type VII secretion target [Thermoactinomyces vulgaris]
MAQIQIDPDHVEQVAKQFQAKRQESEQIIQHLKGQITGLEGQWKGMTKERFFSDFQEAEQNMKNFTLLLENISTALTQIATKFRQTDQA